MDRVRAHEINGDIAHVFLDPFSPKGEIGWKRLAILSLAEMLEAKSIIEAENAATPTVNGGRTFSVVPDDRLIASIYCALHHDAIEAPWLNDAAEAGEITEVLLTPTSVLLHVRPPQ